MKKILLPLILMAAFLLRFYNNTAVALWHDEAFSALYIRYPWREMMQRIILDVHPPLYYLILRLWSYVLSDSLPSLRMLSIVFGCLTVWAAYKFVTEAFKNRRLGLLSAAFVALNPFQIQYALEARMYTLGTFLALFSSYLLVRAINAERKKYLIWLAYAIAVSAALYTHYYLFFSVAAQGVFLLIYALRQKSVRTLVTAAAAYAVGAVLYLPWLGAFLEQKNRVEGSFWIPPMEKWSIPGTVWKMAFGGPGVRHILLLIATLITLALVIFFLRKTKNIQKWHIFLGLAVPFVGAIALSFQANIYLDRYFVFASLYFSILVALALGSVPGKKLSAALIALFLAGSVFSFWGNWREQNIQAKPGMAATAKLLNEKVETGDKIYVGSSFIFFTFKYYNHTGVTPLLISTEPVEKIPHFSGTAILTNNDLILNYKDTPVGTHVWLLWTTGFGGSKPEIPVNWLETSETGYEDSPGFKGWIVVTEYQVK